MAWQMGHPLSQTVFTSQYVEDILVKNPQSLISTRFGRETGDEPFTIKVLRAYCIGLIKTCSLVNSRIKTEHYYEVCMQLNMRTSADIS